MAGLVKTTLDHSRDPIAFIRTHGNLRHPRHFDGIEWDRIHVWQLSPHHCVEFLFFCCTLPSSVRPPLVSVRLSRSFAHNSFTHNIVAHTHSLSHTHNFETHNSHNFATPDLQTHLFHTHTQPRYTQPFPTQLCHTHTHSLTHTQVCHTHTHTHTQLANITLSHTTLSHTALSHTHNIVTHTQLSLTQLFQTHTHVSHNYFTYNSVTQLFHTICFSTISFIFTAFRIPFSHLCCALNAACFQVQGLLYILALHTFHSAACTSEARHISTTRTKLGYVLVPWHYLKWKDVERIKSRALREFIHDTVDSAWLKFSRSESPLTRSDSRLNSQLSWTHDLFDADWRRSETKRPTKVGAAPSIPFFTLCGDGSRVAKIQVEATSLLAKAAAEEMCWCVDFGGIQMVWPRSSWKRKCSALVQRVSWVSSKSRCTPVTWYICTQVLHLTSFWLRPAASSSSKQCVATSPRPNFTQQVVMEPAFLGSWSTSCAWTSPIRSFTMIHGLMMRTK